MNPLDAETTQKREMQKPHKNEKAVKDDFYILKEITATNKDCKGK